MSWLGWSGGGAGAGAGANAYGTVVPPAGTTPVAGSASDTLTLTSTDSTVTITGTAASDTINFAITKPKNCYIWEVQASGTNGHNNATFTSGAWRTRVLNTLDDADTTGITIASNQMTIPTGTYDIQVFVPAFNVNRHRCRLYNITDAVKETSVRGVSFHDVYMNYTTAQGRFTVTGGPKVYEIQHICQTTTAGGFGLSIGNNVSPEDEEVYTSVKITKVA